MKQISTFFKLMLTSMLTLLMLTTVQSQVTQDTIWTSGDLTLASGTGQALGDYKDRNFGAGRQQSRSATLMITKL